MTDAHDVEIEAPIVEVDSDPSSALRELHRQRQDLHRTEKSLTLRIKAKCRRLCEGDKGEAGVLYDAMFGKGTHPYTMHALIVSAPFIEARNLIAPQRQSVEALMVQQAETLPVASWVEGVRGFGLLGLAMIVGETGLKHCDAKTPAGNGNYPTVSKLWKRLGLAVINGECQQRKSGADALDHGYSPSRRSVMWTIGDAMVKGGAHYRDVYLTRKAYEQDKAHRAGLTVAPAAYIKKRKHPERYMSEGHVHRRAQRYMEKMLIKDLWVAWREYD